MFNGIRCGVVVVVGLWPALLWAQSAALPSPAEVERFASAVALTTGARAAGTPASVVRGAKGRRYHRPGCPLARPPLAVLGLAEATAQGLQPCRKCLGGGAVVAAASPAASPAPAVSPAPSPAPPSPAPVAPAHRGRHRSAGRRNPASPPAPAAAAESPSTSSVPDLIVRGPKASPAPWDDPTTFSKTSK